MNAHRTSMNATHISMSPNGKYTISEDDLEELYHLISTSKTPPHILETRIGLTAGPLLIDLDFEYPDEERFHTRQYTHDQVFKFVELIHSAITYFFGSQEVEYVVSEKPEPTIETGKRVKDGIHVLGKGLLMSYKDQHLLRNYALQKHFLQNSFSIDYVQNKPESIYDKSVVSTNAWYLLGCSKPDRPPYLPTLSIFEEEDSFVMSEVDASLYSIADLSIRCGGDPVECLDDRSEEWYPPVEVQPTKVVKESVGDPEAVSVVSH